MFINLSNHSSENWNEEQMAEAHKYGDVIDIHFPAVDPRADSEEIDRKVEELYAQVMAYEKPVVMLQGEFILTFRLVTKLKAAGLRVVAACSERNTVEEIDEEGNTVKKIRFEFVGFKEY